MTDLPIPYGLKALSVRQPWAWAILNGKDVENRSHASIRHMSFRGVERIAIHAAKGMTQDEYEGAAIFMRRDLGVPCPPAIELARGGIIGSARVVGVVNGHKSPWFMGPRAIVLTDPQPCDFVPARGQLGLFDWEPAGRTIVPPPARWMLAGPQSKSSAEEAAKEPGLPL